MHDKDGVLTMSQKKKDDKILICPNPLATSTGGMSADSGNLMPPAIHGGVAMENSGKWMFKNDLSEEEMHGLLSSSEIENPRFDMSQFTKYDERYGTTWCALLSDDGKCLSAAALRFNHPYKEYLFVDEI